MSTARLRLAVAGETMFPHARSRQGLARASSCLARTQRAPFFSRSWGTSRFPTPLSAHVPEVGP